MTFALRRILVTVPLLLVVSLIAFGLAELLPGDASYTRFERHPEQREKWAEQRGLDDPFLVRWGRYVAGVVTEFDLDRSYWDDRPIAAELGEKLQATFELTFVALILAILVGVAVGILSAMFPRTPVDYAGNLFALTGISVPVFWLGLLLIFFWTKVLGFDFVSNRYQPEGLTTNLFLLESLARLRFGDVGRGLQSIWLPALTLATIPMAVITRMTRAAMLDELHQDYARTARAKGLRRRKVVLKHVLRNALIPITTITGLQFGALMGGAVLTERIFSWPGLGTYIVAQAVDRRDTPVMVGGILLIAAMFVFVNLVVDLLYAVIDPRVRKGGA